MTAHSNAKRAYASPFELRPARHTEFAALAQATQKIRQEATATQPVFAKLAEALHHNSQIWIAWAGDVASADNKLPADLRSRIFYLAEFTQHHTSKVLNGDANVKPLLEINVAVLKGLSGRSTSS